jgi:hypothetical protein
VLRPLPIFWTLLQKLLEQLQCCSAPLFLRSWIQPLHSTRTAVTPVGMVDGEQLPVTVSHLLLADQTDNCQVSPLTTKRTKPGFAETSLPSLTLPRHAWLAPGRQFHRHETKVSLSHGLVALPRERRRCTVVIPPPTGSDPVVLSVLACFRCQASFREEKEAPQRIDVQE